MKKVNSSNIEAIGYEPQSQTLLVEFKTGKTYEYTDVPLEVFEAMEKSESVGKFHNQFIKNKYQYVLANDPALSLLETIDGKVWAQIFMEKFQGKLETIDEDLMHVWFSNAIMAGYDRAKKETVGLA